MKRIFESIYLDSPEVSDFIEEKGLSFMYRTIEVRPISFNYDSKVTQLAAIRF